LSAPQRRFCDVLHRALAPFDRADDRLQIGFHQSLEVGHGILRVGAALDDVGGNFKQRVHKADRLRPLLSGGLGRLFNWSIVGLRSSQSFINQFTHASSLRSWQ
jgi:hypothetical protein